jgi:hypothetical protein
MQRRRSHKLGLTFPSSEQCCLVQLTKKCWEWREALRFVKILEASVSKPRIIMHRLHRWHSSYMKEAERKVSFVCFYLQGKHQQTSVLTSPHISETVSILLNLDINLLNKQRNLRDKDERVSSGCDRNIVTCLSDYRRVLDWWSHLFYSFIQRVATLYNSLLHTHTHTHTHTHAQ